MNLLRLQIGRVPLESTLERTICKSNWFSESRYGSMTFPILRGSVFFGIT